MAANCAANSMGVAPYIPGSGSPWSLKLKRLSKKEFDACVVIHRPFGLGPRGTGQSNIVVRNGVSHLTNFAMREIR
jgi:hypothetical protein